MSRLVRHRMRCPAEDSAVFRGSIAYVKPAPTANGLRSGVSTILPRSSRLGRIREQKASEQGGLPFYSYLPNSTSHPSRLPLLVTVHGISRNALELITLFAPHAERLGFALIAPRFESASFDDYQRLGRLGRGERADHALEDVIHSFSDAHDLEFDRRIMFGYSGGGQFVHRFAMAYPERVDAAVVAAAGWYTAPDPRRRYPYGLRVAGCLPGTRIDPVKFLRVPILTIVGGRDDARDGSVRITPRLDREQGLSRVERARRWTQMMREAAIRFGVSGHHELLELPGVRHSFIDCMNAGLAQRLFEFVDRCDAHSKNRIWASADTGGPS